MWLQWRHKGIDVHSPCRRCNRERHCPEGRATKKGGSPVQLLLLRFSVVLVWPVLASGAHVACRCVLCTEKQWENLNLLFLLPLAQEDKQQPMRRNNIHTFPNRCQNHETVNRFTPTDDIETQDLSAVCNERGLIWLLGVCVLERTLGTIRRALDISSCSQAKENIYLRFVPVSRDLYVTWADNVSVCVSGCSYRIPSPFQPTPQPLLHPAGTIVLRCDQHAPKGGPPVLCQDTPGRASQVAALVGDVFCSGQNLSLVSPSGPTSTQTCQRRKQTRRLGRITGPFPT